MSQCALFWLILFLFLVRYFFVCFFRFFTLVFRMKKTEAEDKRIISSLTFCWKDNDASTRIWKRSTFSFLPLPYFTYWSIFTYESSRLGWRVGFKFEKEKRKKKAKVTSGFSLYSYTTTFLVCLNYAIGSALCLKKIRNVSLARYIHIAYFRFHIHLIGFRSGCGQGMTWNLFVSIDGRRRKNIKSIASQFFLVTEI